MELTCKRWFIYCPPYKYSNIIEIYKIEHNLSESWLKDLCSAVNDNYNILSEFDFRVTA